MVKRDIKITPPDGKCAVYADIDGTLSATNIVQPLFWFNLRCFTFPLNLLRVVKIFTLCPYWLALDRFSREKSNISIYKQYRGIAINNFLNMVSHYYHKRFKPKLYKDALVALEEFRKKGYSIALVTGGIHELVRPVADELNAEGFAILLETNNGKFTGNIAGKPLTGSAKSDIVGIHASKNGINLRCSYALGDAYGDLEMLESVGYPVAVNPDRRLRKIAEERGWQIVWWK